MLMVRFLYKFHISCEYFISLLSVKIWLANIEGLNRCTNAEEVPFALVAEVTDLSAPVSAISLAVPAGSQYEVNLAIGRVSGSVETWICNTCSRKIENTNACHAHDQVVCRGVWMAIVYTAAVRIILHVVGSTTETTLKKFPCIQIFRSQKNQQIYQKSLIDALVLH